MNPSQLPPKSPGSFGSFGVAGAMVVDSSSTAAARSSLPASLRPVAAGSHHKRTPSTGFLPHTQPTWIDGVVEVPDDLFKRGAHHRSASESMAFLDGTNFSKMVDDNINEEDDYESRSVASLQSGGHSGAGSLDFDRLDEDQLMSMFGNNDDEPNQKQQQQGSNKSRGDAERVRTFNKDVPSTPDSDSNSMSEVSNEDPKGGLGSGDHEAGTQTFSKGELQQALAGLDSTLDPKRAKRILANRQSAQRSRVRKLQYISELERSVTALQSEVSTMGPQVAFFEHRRALLNVDNNSIKHKMAALLQNQLFQDGNLSSSLTTNRLVTQRSSSNGSAETSATVPAAPTTFTGGHTHICLRSPTTRQLSNRSNRLHIYNNNFRFVLRFAFTQQQSQQQHGGFFQQHGGFFHMVEYLLVLLHLISFFTRALCTH